MKRFGLGFYLVTRTERKSVQMYIWPHRDKTYVWHPPWSDLLKSIYSVEKDCSVLEDPPTDIYSLWGIPEQNSDRLSKEGRKETCFVQWSSSGRGYPAPVLHTKRYLHPFYLIYKRFCYSSRRCKKRYWIFYSP